MAGPPVAHNPDGSEAILPATRRAISFYLVLALVVVPIFAITPASWCYVVYSLYTGSIWNFTSRQYAFFAAAVAEVRPLLHNHAKIYDESPGCIHPGTFQRIPL